MDTPLSDVLVFFGATGDLAYKQIFPALQAMARHGHLDIPVIGVARSNWTDDQLRARARQSVTAHGGLDEAAFAKLASLLRYQSVDYTDPTSFQRLRQTLDGAHNPVFYLAIPPEAFADVAAHLASSGCSENARVIVEKPFGRDLASARALNQTLRRYFGRGGHLPHRPLSRQRGCTEPALLPLRQLVPGADLEQQLHPERATDDGGDLRRRGTRRIL